MQQPPDYCTHCMDLAMNAARLSQRAGYGERWMAYAAETFLNCFTHVDRNCMNPLRYCP